VLSLYGGLTAIIDTLESQGIQYALCGGIAVAVHGFTRATVDIDVWETRERLAWRGRPITVVSREGLVKLKKFRGSKLDLADIEYLENGG